MAFKTERFNYAVPYDLATKEFNHWIGADVLRFAVMHLLDCIFKFFNALAHLSIISTRSRTVQHVFVTPAAIAGVHRIAMLDFTKLQ